MIPTELIERAVEECGQKYVFVYPKREWTDADLLSGSDRPSGKRIKGYYGVCTYCRAVFDYPFQQPPDHITNELIKKNDGQMCPGNNLLTCPACGHDVISRKGWVGKKNLKHWFYCAMWEVKSPREVWLHEAIIREHNWENWDEDGQDVGVYFLRRTILTPGKSQSYDRDLCPVKKARASSDFEASGGTITSGWGALVSESYDFNVIGEEELSGTFLHGILGALYAQDNVQQIVRTDFLIRLNEEPITELLYKSGYYNLAWERVYKRSAAHGTKLINYAAKSPKAMFRGLKKSCADKKLLEVLRDIDPGARGDLREWELGWAAEFLKKHKTRTEPLTELFSLKRRSFALSLVDTLAPHWSLERIMQYYAAHDPIFWRDYLKAAVNVGENLAERRVAFPEDLRTAHDEMMLRDQRCKETATMAAVKARFVELAERGYVYRRRNICTVVPEAADDIIAEGISLSHCVGRYVEEHADGETNIIFIRHTDSPKKSWFTLEVDPDTLEFVQCYGEHNNVSGIPDGDYADTYDPAVWDFLQNYARRLKWGAANYKKSRRKKKCRKTA